ncbi:MAG: phosphoribosylformylglycinamidine cyclo-ligase [Planctomycetota bacterium]|jgi:phosphoribosylformylglycinamidine cyclo-ligase
MTYAEAGVDLEAADRIVDLIQAAMRRTHSPRVLGRHGGFAGMFRLDYNEKLFQKNYLEPVLVACADGVGTKVKLAAERGVYDTVGIDCVAMNVNDLIVQGAEPLFFLDYLGLHKNIPRQTAELIEGVARGCELAGCALLGGETAEMPDIYAEGDFDLAGFAVGVVPLRRAIDPMRVEPDDVVIGLASSGIHANGFTLINRILRGGELDADQVYPQLGPRKLGEVLLEPTRIYARPIVTLLHRYKVKRIVSGMAHVTGGGLPGNLARVLPGEVDARIDCGSWTTPPVFDLIQQRGNVEPQEMRRVFNMGVGLVLIVRPTFAHSVERQLNRLGEHAFVMGRIVRGSGKVRLD